MSVSESRIDSWANPPSETEDERCTNAISQITDALHSRFGNDITVIKQGSHRNRTNVKTDSDVDLAIVHTGYFFPDTNGLSEADKERYARESVPASYPYSQFKNDVHAVLQGKFGSSAVERKNKCVRVSGNSYRVNADVVPAYEHHRFSAYNVVSDKGIELVTDEGIRIHSFPEQHYESGVKKNEETGKAFKSVVRILKNVRNEFVDKGLMKLEAMPSFFIESLVWNVPASHFRGTT